MKIALFAPYVTPAPETNLLYLVGRYLARYSDQVTQLHCNGAFSLCAKDRLTGHRRNALTCPRCRSEQKAFADWAEIIPLELSRYLSPDLVTETRRLVMEGPGEELAGTEWRGSSLFELARHEVFARLDGQPPSLQRPDHEQLVRQILLSSARSLAASSAFIAEWKPTLALVAGGEDVLSRGFVEAVLRADVTLVVFRSDPGQELVRAIHPGIGKVWSCELGLASALALPHNPEKWPAELFGAIEDLALTFGLVDAQMALPLAR